jgi:sugar lactone lactonase YvrE
LVPGALPRATEMSLLRSFVSRLAGTLAPPIRTATQQHTRVVQPCHESGRLGFTRVDLSSTKQQRQTMIKMKILNISRFVGGTICTGAMLLGGSDIFAQNIFVGDWVNIFEFSPGKSPTTFNQSTFSGGQDYARCLAFDSAGNLFEADCYSGQIFEFMNTGGTLNSSAVRFAYGLNNPGAMAFDKKGNLFVASDIGNFIYEFTPGNSTPAIYVTGLNSPQGLAFDSGGNLYAANWVGGTITKITPQKAESTFASGLNQPCGLAFDAAGNLYVANTSPFDTITEITPDGVQSTYATGLNNPQQIAFDGRGDLFVAVNGVRNYTGNLTEIAPNKSETVTAIYGSTLSVVVQGQELQVRKRHHWYHLW